jgi:hypothetical protein
MAEDADSVSLALADLENEPLPTHTRERPPPEEAIEVDYDGEAPQSPENLSEKPQNREIPAEEGIEALRERLLTESAARRQAEERANAAEQARAEASGHTQDANVGFLTSALDSVRQGIGILETQLAEAYAVSDFTAVAKLQTELARATQRESQIDTGLEQLKAMPREQPRREAPPAIDQVEAVARQLTPNAANWVRNHPDYVTDRAKNARLMSAHYAAIGDGLTADSPDYIRYVEQRVGLGQQAPQVERRDPVAETRRSAPPPAPVSRAANGPANPTRVTLTRDQRDMARELFPDEMREDPSGRKAEQAYARNILVLKREGRMN